MLYWNPYGGARRATVEHHLAAVARTGAAVAVNAVGGAPSVLRAVRPRAVILHTTFLAIRWLTSFQAWRARSAWLERLDVPKIALPQDDYDHADVLDEWLCSLGVTDVFTPFPEHPQLYRATRERARLHRALTGYVDAAEAARWASSARLREPRPLDIVYRATRLPYWYGRLGQLKAEVGVAARRVAEAASLRHDIVLDEPLAGRQWFEYLASGRLALGCESGASALDRRGELRAQVRSVLAERPGATFDEVSDALPSGWDAWWFAALSPRHFEAAMTGSAQVLVRGDYSGVLIADRHYVPIQPDLSDLQAAVERALDPGVTADLTGNARADLIDSGRYSYDRLTDAIRQVLPDAGGSTGRLTAILATLGARAYSGAVRALAGRRGHGGR